MKRQKQRSVQDGLDVQMSIKIVCQAGGSEVGMGLANSRSIREAHAAKTNRQRELLVNIDNDGKRADSMTVLTHGEKTKLSRVFLQRVII